VSWYRPHLETSLRLIEESQPDRDGRIIDVGGGESTLVDDLLSAGYSHVEVLDLSPTALQFSQRRVGELAARVGWHCGDVTRYPFEPSSFDLWHDRAVFHFLTSSEERAAYVQQVAHSVKPGGHVIVATFGPKDAEQMLRAMLGTGADRAIRVDATDDALDGERSDDERPTYEEEPGMGEDENGDQPSR